MGNISDAIKLADDEAGDPNMNKTQVSISRCTGLSWIKILTGKRIPVIPTKYQDYYMWLKAFCVSPEYQREGRLIKY